MLIWVKTEGGKDQTEGRRHNMSSSMLAACRHMLHALMIIPSSSGICSRVVGEGWAWTRLDWEALMWAEKQALHYMSKCHAGCCFTPCNIIWCDVCCVHGLYSLHPHQNYLPTQLSRSLSLSHCRSDCTVYPMAHAYHAMVGYRLVIMP